MTTESITKLAQRVVEFLTALSIIGTALWFIAEPRAEDFVRSTVNDQIADLQNQLKALATAEAAAERSNIRSESDLASLKELQRQTQDMLGVILKATQH